MSKRTHRLLSNPFSENDELLGLFENLSLRTESNSNSQRRKEMEQLIARLEAQMTALVATNAELTRKLTQLEENQAALQRPTAMTVTEYSDIVPTYTSGDSIQLDAFKVIPEFNGEKKIYRSWRSQVSNLMKQIETFKQHPKYAAALSIIRAKITGAASDILINNNTAHNINAIIDRLDFSYADQRPLYVIEAEMTTIKQGGKTLQEFYDAINQALNMVLTKIAMTYKEAAEQKSLTTEVQSKAIRTFVTGMNSTLIRTTLYGSMPKTLSEAFAIAQTIQYDNQHLQLENRMPIQQKNMKKTADVKQNFNPNFQYQFPQPNQASKQNATMTPEYKRNQGSTPMEIDGSAQFVQKTQFQPNDTQFKRPRDPSYQYTNKHQFGSSAQHINKQQRVNHLDEQEDIRSVYDNSLENNCETEAADSQSTASEQGSIFLEE